jgi:hypothetical protein
MIPSREIGRIAARLPRGVPGAHAVLSAYKIGAARAARASLARYAY